MATAAIVALLAPLGTLPAAAHAIVLESVPARDAVLERAPERVILRFNSKIEKRLTRVTIGARHGTPSPVSIASDDPGGAWRPVGKGLLRRSRIGVRPPSSEVTTVVELLNPTLCR